MTKQALNTPAILVISTVTATCQLHTSIRLFVVDDAHLFPWKHHLGSLMQVLLLFLQGYKESTRTHES